MLPSSPSTAISYCLRFLFSPPTLWNSPSAISLLLLLLLLPWWSQPTAAIFIIATAQSHFLFEFPAGLSLQMIRSKGGKKRPFRRNPVFQYQRERRGVSWLKWSSVAAGVLRVTSKCPKQLGFFEGRLAAASKRAACLMVPA